MFTWFLIEITAKFSSAEPLMGIFEALNFINGTGRVKREVDNSFSLTNPTSLNLPFLASLNDSF